ncbi:MAG: DUF4338 domain-containing protein [Gammaproteobacteria bacterium]|nr:DUF4338 domain-containing protein [Gammaproteobacteria bacterium]
MSITNSGSIIQSGREITPEEIHNIMETAREFRWLSRKELAMTISEHLEWFTASGGNKVDACMKLLMKLEGMGLLSLPLKQERYQLRKCGERVSITNRTEPGDEIRGEITEIGEVKLEAVNNKEAKSLWNEYVDRYHYLGYKQPFGYHLRYFIKTGSRIVGCILLAGAAKALGVRDKWIGWTDSQRIGNLAWVVNNTRYLILPWVKIKNLASHVLGQLSRYASIDWEARWGYKPVLIETFVDSRYYRGSCYRAANWQYLGNTTGEGLARIGKRYTTTPKMIFVKPLVKDFRAQLCSDKLTGRVE